MDVFGKIFKELREEKGLKQKEVAAILNVSAATVSNWEAGRKLPEILTLIKISQYFEASIDYMLGLEN